MAQVTAQSELMTQTVAAQAIDYSEDFFVVHDASNQPMMFSIGDQGILYAILVGASGHNELVQLNDKFRIPTSSTVTALTVTQDPDGTTYLVVAEHIGSTANDKIHVMSGVPADFDWTSTSDLSDYLFKDVSSSIPTIANEVAKVKSFLQGTNDDGQGFPFLVVTYVDPTGAHVDIAPISVDQKNKTWTFSTDAVLPEDASASKMTALSTGSIFNYRGLFTLYGIAGNQQLVWIAENSKYHKQIQAVHDVSKYDFNCLAAFANADGDSELFLGAGDGLYYFSAADLSTGGTKSKPTLPVMISQDPAFVNIQELYITTNEMVISVWAATGANQIVYQQFDFDINPLTPAVTLLGGGAGGHFAALLHPLNGSQQLFVLDSSQAKKTVTLLEQSGVSRLWQTSPYIIPSTGTNYDFTSYTAHIKIAGSDGLPIGTDAGAKHYVQLSCDGIMNVTCNGNAYTINSTGSTVEVDSSGCVTVMIPTNDLASPCLFLGDVPGATETYFNGAPVKIDPARKVKDGLAKVSDGPSLQTQAGSALPTGTSNESLQHAGPAVSQLHGEANKLSNTASSPHELDTLLKAATADGSTSWDLWHMLEKGIVQVLEFELQTIERAGKDVLHFVATLSKETFRFALISAEYCFKAISWVLKNFLGIDLSALIKWLGFLFGWDDIMDTQVVVVGYLNKFIDLTIQQIPTWAQDADSLLSDIENQANAVFGKSLPKDTNDQQSSNRHVNTTANSDTTTSDAGASPGANWLNYNVQHGSVGQSVSPSDSNTLTVASGDDDPMTKTSKAWDDCLGSIAHILGDIASDVFNLFRGDFTVGGIKQKLQSMLQDVIHDAMEGLKNFVNAIALTTIDLLKLFKTAANAELTKIPLLSFLWKVIGRGETFSMLNLVGLLIAIPTTVVTKMVTKKAPSASPAYPKIQAILNPRVSKTRTSTKESDLAITATNLGDTTDTLSELVWLAGTLLQYGQGFAGPVSLIFSMMDWAAPDAPLKLMGTIAAVGAAAASFPTDVVSSVRPAYLFRNLECMMKFSQAFIIWSTDNKEDRAVKLYPCVILRGIFISVSAIEDLCADKTEYPLLDYGTLWLYETNRWLSWGGDVANAITLQSRGTNQVSAATYIVTTMVVFVASEFLVADRGDDYDQGAHVPPIPQPM